MKLSMRKLLCLLLALCLVLGCFAGCDDSSSGREDDDDEEEIDPAAEAREKLDSYELNGLTYYLSDDFADEVDYGFDSNYHSNGNGIEIQVTAGSMGDMTDEEITTSEEFAQFFMDFLGDMYDEAEMSSRYGIYYMVGIYEGVANIMGYYVQDGYGWIIYAANEDGEATDELIDMVTLGKIDKDFDPDEYLSNDDSDEDIYVDDYEDEYVDDYEDEYVESDEDCFTVHAYVPDSWGHPGCWAWSSISGENVFSAWPGEYMTWEDGYYYTIQIPTWADYIIVNGNDGAIQTGDEPVYGGDVWVIVDISGDSYGVYFDAPDDELLSDYGY